MRRITSLLWERAARSGASGSHCPATGPWSPEGEPQIVQPFSEGHVFPAYNGIATTWRPADETP
jgi:hypothetical protein